MSSLWLRAETADGLGGDAFPRVRPRLAAHDHHGRQRPRLRHQRGGVGAAVETVISMAPPCASSLKHLLNIQGGSKCQVSPVGPNCAATMGTSRHQRDDQPLSDPPPCHLFGRAERAAGLGRVGRGRAAEPVHGELAVLDLRGDRVSTCQPYNNQPQVLHTSTATITDNTCLIR